MNALLPKIIELHSIEYDPYLHYIVLVSDIINKCEKDNKKK